MDEHLLQLEDLLKRSNGIDFFRCFDHDSNRWVQTTLRIKKGRRKVEMGILDHTEYEFLSAKLYPLRSVKAGFPVDVRESVAEVYKGLTENLSNLRYRIDKLSPDLPLVAHVMMWQS
tara:strand:+ start:1957 stop:2307 length:351 start_codon:yes stop_codon:yes gene_type:complete